MQIEIKNDEIFVELTNRQAAYMSAVYVRSRKCYKVPYTLGALRELHQLGFPVMEEGKKLLAQRTLVMQEKEKELDTSTPLRPYQKQDVNFLLNIGTGANFSQQRTGKTPTLCETLQQLNKKAIVIVPAGIVLNWVEELKKWTSLNAYTFPPNATPKRRSETYQDFYNSDADVLVMSKGLARNDLALMQFLNYEIVVIDEAHFLRNFQTKQSEAMYTLGRRAEHRYVLTGTPATNTLVDIYGILKFLYPSRFRSYWQFAERYFKINDGFFGKTIGTYLNPDRQKELTEVIEEISVQRKRKEVMKWLPDKQYQTIKLEMCKKQQKAYRNMLELFAVEGTDLNAPSVLAQLTRLRQLTVAPSMLELDIPSVKEQFLLEWLADHPTESVVIFSNFSSYIKQLKKKIKGSEMIIGEVPKETRQSIMRNFQSGGVKVLLANIVAAGTGLTLDRADTVIFLDRAYTPTENEQAEDRIIATTEESNQSSSVIDLVCVGTIDEKIIKMVKEKKNITELINNYKNIREFLE